MNGFVSKWKKYLDYEADVMIRMYRDGKLARTFTILVVGCHRRLGNSVLMSGDLFLVSLTKSYDDDE